jgi:hypothetical protein
MPFDIFIFAAITVVPAARKTTMIMMIFSGLVRLGRERTSNGRQSFALFEYEIA